MSSQKKSFFIWEGVYPTVDDTPKRGPGFDQPKLVQKFILALQKVRKSAGVGRSVRREPHYNQSVLPVLAGVVLSGRGSVKIVDFGGGIGIDYFRVRSALPPEASLTFTIIESPRVCVAGKKEFFGDSRVRFLVRLPARLSADIVHIGSALQYIRDWKRVLTDLVRRSRPRYFLFTDLPAGDIPTFASVQVYYGSKIPYWFFNVSDIVTVMRSLGFVLHFRSAYEYRYLDTYRNVPVSNFPSQYRLPYSCNLLFVRKRS